MTSRIAGALAVLLLLLALGSPANAFVKATVQVMSWTNDGTTLTFYTLIQITGQAALTHPFAGLLTNIADAPAAIAFLKGQVVSYASSQFSVTIVANDVLIFGGPQ